MIITQKDASSIILFECKDKNCGETWVLALAPDGTPLGTLKVDDHHLGVMLAATQNDPKLQQAIAKATKSP